MAAPGHPHAQRVADAMDKHLDALISEEKLDIFNARAALHELLDEVKMTRAQIEEIADVVYATERGSGQAIRTALSELKRWARRFQGSKHKMSKRTRKHKMSKRTRKHKMSKRTCKH